MRAIISQSLFREAPLEFGDAGGRRVVMELLDSSVWTAVDRISTIVTLLGVFSIFGYLVRFARRFVGRPRGTITKLDLDLDERPKYKGLICPVSAPFPSPRAAPDAVRANIQEAEFLDQALRDGPIGTILKAIEHHQVSLRHCWLLGSPDSKPYFPIIQEAGAKYFPDVRIHDPITVDDVYGAIDDVYNAVHGIFGESKKTWGVEPEDIITDVTGGTKIMSIGLALACLPANRHIEYIDQKDRKTFYSVEITWETITRPIIS
jgi:CRISPR-associated protein (Cas_Cas02710)